MDVMFDQYPANVHTPTGPGYTAVRVTVTVGGTVLVHSTQGELLHEGPGTVTDWRARFDNHHAHGLTVDGAEWIVSQGQGCGCEAGPSRDALMVALRRIDNGGN